METVCRDGLASTESREISRQIRTQWLMRCRDDGCYWRGVNWPTVSRDASSGCVISNFQDLWSQNGQKWSCQVIPRAEAELDWDELLTGLLTGVLILKEGRGKEKLYNFYSIVREIVSLLWALFYLIISLGFSLNRKLENRFSYFEQELIALVFLLISNVSL